MPPSSRPSKKNKCGGCRFPKESTAPAAVRAGNGNSERDTPGGSQRVKKASQSLPPAGGKEIKIIFCRGAPQGGLSCPFGAIHLLYLTENTTQAASVRFVRLWRTNRARGRLQSFCQKRALPFFDSLTPGGSVRNALRRCVRCVKILPCIQKGESACAENMRLPGQSAGMDCC